MTDNKNESHVLSCSCGVENCEGMSYFRVFGVFKRDHLIQCSSNDAFCTCLPRILLDTSLSGPVPPSSEGDPMEFAEFKFAPTEFYEPPEHSGPLMRDGSFWNKLNETRCNDKDIYVTGVFDREYFETHIDGDFIRPIVNEDVVSHDTNSNESLQETVEREWKWFEDETGNISVTQTKGPIVSQETVEVSQQSEDNFFYTSTTGVVNVTPTTQTGPLYTLPSDTAGPTFVPQIVCLHGIRISDSFVCLSCNEQANSEQRLRETEALVQKLSEELSALASDNADKEAQIELLCSKLEPDQETPMVNIGSVVYDKLNGKGPFVVVGESTNVVEYDSTTEKGNSNRIRKIEVDSWVVRDGDKFVAIPKSALTTARPQVTVRRSLFKETAICVGVASAAAFAAPFIALLLGLL